MPLPEGHIQVQRKTESRLPSPGEQVTVGHQLFPPKEQLGTAKSGDSLRVPTEWHKTLYTVFEWVTLGKENTASESWETHSPVYLGPSLGSTQTKTSASSDLETKSKFSSFKDKQSV